MKSLAQQSSSLTAETLLEHDNGKIGAHLGAQGATGTLLGHDYRCRGKTLEIEMLAETNEVTRAGNSAEAAPFAS